MNSTMRKPFDTADPADAVFVAAMAAPCDRRISEAIDCWRRIRPGPGLIPGRQHFDPLEIPRVLPFLGLADVVRESTLRIRVRMVGMRLSDTFGPNVVGRFLDEMVPDFEKTRAGQDYLSVATEGVPVWYRGHQSMRVGKSHLPVERLFLPLAADGRTVDMILAIFVFGPER